MPTAERRAAPRHVVHLPSTITVGERTYRCLVVDLAQGGAVVDAPAPVSEGDRVVLRLAGQQDITARVVRTTETGFALAFAGVAILGRAAAE
jgi:hypothetical protein